MISCNLNSVIHSGIPAISRFSWKFVWLGYLMLLLDTWYKKDSHEVPHNISIKKTSVITSICAIWQCVGPSWKFTMHSIILSKSAQILILFTLVLCFSSEFDCWETTLYPLTVRVVYWFLKGWNIFGCLQVCCVAGFLYY